MADCLRVLLLKLESQTDVKSDEKSDEKSLISMYVKIS